MNQYGPVALALGLIALSIGLWELSWFRRSGALGRKTFPAFSTHQIWCIACSAALALANGVGAMMGHEGMDFYTDICTVARCLWVYHYVQLLMAFFDPRGNGDATARAHGRDAREGEVARPEHPSSLQVLFRM